MIGNLRKTEGKHQFISLDGLFIGNYYISILILALLFWLSISELITFLLIILFLFHGKQEKSKIITDSHFIFI